LSPIVNHRTHPRRRYKVAISAIVIFEKNGKMAIWRAVFQKIPKQTLPHHMLGTTSLGYAAFEPFSKGLFKGPSCRCLAACTKLERSQVA
jgi:hypothetical protein